MSVLYSKQNPFKASVKERYSLCKPGSGKNTQHLVLDLKDSQITYEVGDSVGIYPQYDSELVDKTIQAMKGKKNDLIHSKHIQGAVSLAELLTTKVDINTVSQKLFREVMHRQTNLEKKHALEVLLKEENREALKQHLSDYEVWDFLLDHPEVDFTSQELVDLLMPLLPRFYSISSSQKCVGDEMHLTVAALEYESRGHQRKGVCTHFLCNLTELHDPAVPLFIQPSHGFKLPTDNHAPMIMIGPGTGIAPFRAFMQERLLHHQSQGKHWLFFGERNGAYDFFYEQDWRTLASRGHLKVDAAFSRDQDKKVYVQHKMLEQGAEIFQWLENGAYLYVCGDAKRMARDVEAALHFIICEYGRKTDHEAKEYIKHLRQQKRYLRDVY